MQKIQVPIPRGTGITKRIRQQHDIREIHEKGDNNNSRNWKRESEARA